MSATTVKLLQAAAEVLGGHRALAESLGISETLLFRFIADAHELPDPLLLRAVDIILADRQSGFSRLPRAKQTPQDCGRGSGAATRTESA